MTAVSNLLRDIDATERGFVLSRFNANDAWDLGCHLREIVAEIRAPVSILIRRGTGTTVFACSLHGATADNTNWAARKAAAAIWFERSTLAVATDFKNRNLTVADFGLSQADYAVAPGAVPLYVDGAGCVAAIAMSGLSGAEDHGLVVKAISWLQRKQVA